MMAGLHRMFSPPDRWKLLLACAGSARRRRECRRPRAVGSALAPRTDLSTVTIIPEPPPPPPEPLQTPANLTVVGETVFFTRDEAERGNELWKSHAVEGGIALVKD